MSRDAAIKLAETYFDSGGFKADLARRVAIPTESQNPDRADELKRYLDAEMVPALEALGFRCRLLTHAKARGPFLVAERIEAAHLPTVLCYGHGDVIRGLEAGWAKGLSPFVLTEKDGRYYGRGVADNKGQHTIGIAAMGAVIAARGRLGFNAKWLIEMGEETGSAGLREVCAKHRLLFAADALIGSDGPRISIEQPTIDPGWGEPGLSSAEKLYGWSTFEILAMSAGNPEAPVNAVPPKAWARGQLRFVVGVDPEEILPALRRHLDRHGFAMVEIAKARDEIFHATRLDPDHPWAQWAAASIARTAGRKPAILPSTGGALPNDVFSELLGLPTIWVPHSYPGCSQHAPNEHLPLPLAREGLRLMAGLYWDLGEGGTPGRK